MKNKYCYDSKKIYTFYNEAEEILAGKMPKPRMALIYPSRICTHDCYYCSDRWDNKKVNSFMDPEQFLKLPQRLKKLGVESIELCGGGEPTLHPNIKEFIKEAAKYGLKLASLTNGTMIRGELLELVVANFSYFRVSMDSFNPEVYKKIRRPKSVQYELPAVLENVKNAVELKRKLGKKIQIGLKINIAFDNVNDIYDSIQKAVELGVDSIQIKIARNADEGEPSEEKKNKVREQIERGKKDFSDKITILGNIDKYQIDHRCWMAPAHIFIDTNGDVRICCYFQFREKDHTFGNAFKESLEDIWYGQKHFEAMKNIDIEKCNQWDCKYFNYNKILKEAVMEDEAQWQFT